MYDITSDTNTILAWFYEGCYFVKHRTESCLSKVWHTGWCFRQTLKRPWHKWENNTEMDFEMNKGI